MLSFLLQINLIQLDPNNEDLRETVFWSMFRNSLLFDNLDTAANYRVQLVALRKSPPNMYTLTGEKIDSNGILVPGNAGRMPLNLPYVFGQYDRNHMENLRHIENGMYAICKDKV